jgi:adenylate kinase
MQQRIVFVGGVHGSGKTTICRLLVDSLPVAHVTAGALIREAADPAHVVTVGAQDKAVPDVKANQDVLLRGLSAYRARMGPEPILLDGHFALMDPSGCLVDVPSAVFADIAPVCILLVEADAHTVHKRLSARAADGPSVTLIRELGERERARATETAVALKIPLWLLAGDGEAGQSAAEAAAYLRPLLGGTA